MKKIMICLGFGLLIIMVLSLCIIICKKEREDRNIETSKKGVDVEKDEFVDKNEIDVYSELEKEYNSFLDDLYRKKKSSKGSYSLSFLLKDMDSDSIPELVIKKNTKLIIYAYTDKEIVKIGKTDEFGGTGRYFYSNKSSYPGIFYFHVGGGCEHYGYIYVENNHMISQELWNEDYSGISEILGKNRGKIEEISLDKQIIDESKIVCAENQELVFREVVPSYYQEP